MSKNLRACLSNMNMVCETKNTKVKKSLLNAMSCEDCYFKALFEIVTNISKGNLKLTNIEKKKLRKHIKLMEQILAKPEKEARRALAVKQSGGFLNIVIPALIPVISEILKHAVS